MGTNGSGSGDDIQYHFGELTDLGTAMSTAHAKVLDLQGDISSQAGNLSSHWAGKAGESWGTVQTRWNTACQHLGDALHQLGQVITQGSDTMQQQEIQNQRIFDGI
jgi:WXG100 family type VII secretion target